MPAAAVIPAPIAYIKVVAVKKLVVELRGARVGPLARWVHAPALCALAFRRPPVAGDGAPGLCCPGPGVSEVTLSKLECSKQASALNTLAWNNMIGLWLITLVCKTGVMIERDSRGHSYFIVRGEILGFMKDELLRKHLPRMFSLIKNESWGLEDD